MIAYCVIQLNRTFTSATASFRDSARCTDGVAADGVIAVSPTGFAAAFGLLHVFAVLVSYLFHWPYMYMAHT